MHSKYYLSTSCGCFEMKHLIPLMCKSRVRVPCARVCCPAVLALHGAAFRNSTLRNREVNREGVYSVLPLMAQWHSSDESNLEQSQAQTSLLQKSSVLFLVCVVFFIFLFPFKLKANTTAHLQSHQVKLISNSIRKSLRSVCTVIAESLTLNCVSLRLRQYRRCTFRNPFCLNFIEIESSTPPSILSVLVSVRARSTRLGVLGALPRLRAFRLTERASNARSSSTNSRSGAVARILASLPPLLFAGLSSGSDVRRSFSVLSSIGAKLDGPFALAETGA
mmetsp:Transcript_9499/g.25332  ORF Transcript_9499/g.25332 Transcript_9499/m.25332 type:complete len:278 (-) Transcript_9499:1755-2588(-)